jgi:hypothetical protein
MEKTEFEIKHKPAYALLVARLEPEEYCSGTLRENLANVHMHATIKQNED